MILCIRFNQNRLKMKQNIFYFLISSCLILFGCDECKDKVCAPWPNAYFHFNLVDAHTGEDLIFGENPINYPDSISFLSQGIRYVTADKKNKALGFLAHNDTVYIKPDRKSEGKFWYDPINFDTIHFEFQSLGMGECCEEYKITKVFYNDTVYYPEQGVPVQIQKNNRLDSSFY